VFSHHAVKVLNLRTESKHIGAVTFHTNAQNKFIKYLRSIGRQKRFESACSRYADK